MIRNRESSTLTENPGIDLTIAVDEPVRAVADGKINSVTWLRGFGNVCIVEHSGSFYTVYAHLGNLSVENGQLLKKGDIVGGPSLDPLSGEYRLHFELWSGKEKKNPREWLTKSPS
jgi:murein DD-endopeptidase MepM/ murein hydrolase activator NlpD